MGFGGISGWQLLVVLLLALVIFGTSRIRNLGSDLGSAIKGFRKAVADPDKGRSGQAGPQRRGVQRDRQPARRARKRTRPRPDFRRRRGGQAAGPGVVFRRRLCFRLANAVPGCLISALPNSCCWRALGLIVLGPQRLPKVAAQLGRWVGQARRMSRTLMVPVAPGSGSGRSKAVFHASAGRRRRKSEGIGRRKRQAKRRKRQAKRAAATRRKRAETSRKRKPKRRRGPARAKPSGPVNSEPDRKDKEERGGTGGLQPPFAPDRIALPPDEGGRRDPAGFRRPGALCTGSFHPGWHRR